MVPGICEETQLLQAETKTCLAIKDGCLWHPRECHRVLQASESEADHPGSVRQTRVHLECRQEGVVKAATLTTASLGD